MSVPASVRAGPFTSIVLVKKRYIIFYIFLIWISIISISIEFWAYWQLIYHQSLALFYIFLPLLCFVMYITLVLVSLLFAKALLIVVNAIHKPKEGIFLRDPSDKDYRYWSIRNTIKRWPIWVSHKFPFPFLDNICFKVFNIKTTFSNSLFEGWVDCEFIEFGKNVVVGQASIIQSAVIIGNFLIIKKTTIEDNVRIGTHCVVMPGTHIRKNCILASLSGTIVDQDLEKGWIYLGIPAKKLRKNRFFEDGIEDMIGYVNDAEQLREKWDELYVKRYDKQITIEERERLTKERMDD